MSRSTHRNIDMSSPSSSPWSAFHSLKVSVVARPPGTPVRQETTTPPLPKPDTASTVEEFQCCLTQLDLLLEYKLLCVNCPSGVYVLPSSKSLYGRMGVQVQFHSTVLTLRFVPPPSLEWHGVLFVHSGPFREGIFRFTMYIPDRWVTLV